MLPNALFSPLDLRDAIDEAQRVSGAAGVVDLLTYALTDARVRDDSVIDEFLPALKSACRQTRRYRDAVPVFRRIVALNPQRRHEVAAELAVVHGHLREPAAGVALLESALAAQRRLPVRRRSLAFFVVAEVAAVVLGRPTLARAIVAAGRNVLPPAPRMPVPSTAAGPVAARTGSLAPPIAPAPDPAGPDDAALFDLVPYLGRPTLVLVKDSAA